ncbi:carboxypeptidase S, putative [Entamoeba invadens IP1]|uniref:carboxypeptidase S, putative n=1 Tax=Entamoeba invadens IP1 TaxID=370355 RepID=UPI0002C3D5B9|nr:carboxypeptidase S, putative [Entamoeba invadens IP1]ELP85088.1 carboxypeptidase S, putative [Entamoeba invadens IP1]|eukprot:XP_004184434.1 carboxypeptidase S, putative [Entamoeba invadens IP1]
MFLALFTILVVTIVTIFVLLYLVQPHKQEFMNSVELSEVPKDLVNHLKEAISIPTVSKSANENFEKMREWMKTTYPILFEKFTLELFNTNTILLRCDVENTEPLVLLAHHDVVPAPSAGWDTNPFEGTTKDGVVYGRGAMDNKTDFVTCLEALNFLFATNFKPKRSIYFMSGADEEVGGTGCQAVVSELKRRGVTPYVVLDEGYCVLDLEKSFLKRNLALIGFSEKRRLCAKFELTLRGGHASIPPNRTESKMVNQFVSAIEKSVRIKRWNEPVKLMIEEVGRGLPFPLNSLVYHLPKLGSLGTNVVQLCGEKFKALVGTTCVMTYMRMGDLTMTNALPNNAEFVVDIRSFPGDSVKDIEERITKTIERYKKNFKEIKMEWLWVDDKKENVCSNLTCEGFDKIVKTAKEVFGNVIIAPALVIGGTDSTHYLEISDRVFRFGPEILSFKEIGAMHGINEQIRENTVEKAFQYFVKLIQNCC